MDVFFLLHAVAQELSDGAAEIIGRLEEHAATQRRTVFAALQDGLGIPAETVEAICRALCGDVAQALDDLVAPVLAAGADDRAGHGRARRTAGSARCTGGSSRFALLAAKLGLTGVETEVAFRDQDLVGKFPERLALPPGVTTFDALLPSADGHVYLFDGDTCWRYSASTYALEDRVAVPLRTLSGAVRRARPGRRRVRRRRGRRVARRPRPVGPLARVPQGARAPRGGCRRRGPGARSGTTSRTRRASTPPSATPRARPTCSPATSTSATPATTTPRSTRATRGRSRELGRPRGCTARCRRGSRPSVDASFHGLDEPDVPVQGRPVRRVRRDRGAAGRRSGGGGCATPSPAPAAIDAAYTDGRRPVRAARATRSSATPTASRTAACGWTRATRGAWSSTSRTCPRSSRAAIEAAFAEPGSSRRAPVQGRPHGQPGTRRPDRPAGGQAVGPARPGAAHRDGRRRVRRPRRQDLPVQRRPVPPLHRRGLLARRRGLPAADRRRLGRDRRAWTPRSCSTARTHLFGTAGRLFRIPVAEEFEWTAHERRLDAGDVPPELRERLLDARPAPRRTAGWTGTGPEWTVPLDGGAARRRPRARPTRLSVTAVASTTGQFCVRYSGRVLHAARPGLPAAADRRLVEPPGHVGGRGRRSTAWTRCSPAATSGPTCSPATGSSSSTTGAAGGRSRGACATDWDSIPFDARRRRVPRQRRQDLRLPRTGGTSATPATTTPGWTTGTPRRSRASGATSSTPSPAPGTSTPRSWCSRPPEVEGGAGADAHLPVLRAPVRPVRGHRLRDRRRRLPARHRHVAGTASRGSRT